MKKAPESLPRAPGIYLFKKDDGTILYIGKAKSLKNRISSYFAKQESDWKIASLMAEQTIIDYILTNTETEALLLEAQLIQEHKPKYNVLLKDGQPYLYILFTKDQLPIIKLVRNKKEKGSYFGPFLEKIPARRTYDYLLRTFQLRICNKKIQNGCLDFHLGTCAGTCSENFDRDGYLFRLELARDLLKNKSASFKKKLEAKITEYSHMLEFEKAKHLREYLENIDQIFNTLHVRFSESKFQRDIFRTTVPYAHLANNYDTTAEELKKQLSLKKAPNTIDCFDISHFQSKQLVGSSVRFNRGLPEQKSFRHFNIKTLAQQNDYAALQEIVLRRYKTSNDLPDLILIDGGKGQLNAIQSIMPQLKMKTNASEIPECISLAKKEETIFSNTIPDGVRLDIKTHGSQLLIALRDYAHHFAITHHRNRHNKIR